MTGIEAVKTDIRNLLIAQEAYRCDHSRYANDVATLVRGGYIILVGDRAELELTDTGFTATAWNDALKPGLYRCSVEFQVGEMSRLVTE